MNRGQRCLLQLYYYASLPWRKVAARQRAVDGRSPVMVLFYHRVADDHPNPWTMPTADFARQLTWLQRHFDLVSLEEAQRRIAGGRNVRPAVSLTFDDGYADNCNHALPLLVNARVPCTYFVSLQHVREDRCFPHDEQRGQPLRPNSLEELRALAAAGVEIAAHTRTHRDLGPVGDPQLLYDEVVSATRELGSLIGQPVRYFAFPYGLHANLNPRAFQLAREAGIEAVCSAYGGYNFPGDDPFHLQRIHADAELIRLKNWLTVDPRKLRGTVRYEYTLAAAPPEPSLQAAK